MNIDNFYKNLGDPDIERLARAIVRKRGYDPELLINETGYPDSPKIPIWWKYQDDALAFLAMIEEWGAKK